MRYVTFVLLLIVSTIVFLTGLIKFPGLLLFFGLDPRYLPLQLINTLHDWGGIAMIALVWFHIIVHYKWIIAMTRKFAGRSKK